MFGVRKIDMLKIGLKNCDTKVSKKKRSCHCHELRNFDIDFHSNSEIQEMSRLKKVIQDKNLTFFFVFLHLSRSESRTEASLEANFFFFNSRMEYFCHGIRHKFHSGCWMEFWITTWRPRNLDQYPSKAWNALVNGVVKLLKLARQTRRCGVLRRCSSSRLASWNESSLHICKSSLQAVAASTTMNTLGVRKLPVRRVHVTSIPGKPITLAGIFHRNLQSCFHSRKLKATCIITLLSREASWVSSATLFFTSLKHSWRKRKK